MKKCEYCYYYDICTNRRVCRYYDPVINIYEYEDEVIERILLKDREEYIHDWNLYIKQYDKD